MTDLTLAGIALLTLAAAAWHALAAAVARALLTYSRSHLETLCEARGRAGRADAIEADWERTERSIGLHVAASGLVLLALLCAAVALRPPAASWPVLVATIVILGLALRVAAGVVGRVYAESLLDRAWPTIRGLNTVAIPGLAVGSVIEAIVRRRSGLRRRSRPRPASVEVEYESHGGGDDESDEPELSEATRERLEQVIGLEQRDVAEIMTPRSAMVALPATVTAAEAARAAIGSGHSRIPLFGESRDDIVGILYTKDLFAEMVDGTPIDAIRPRRLARPPLCVPETKRASDLIDEMRRQRTHQAMVLDEYGGVSGLVTLEDVLEEIVGAIDDEHDIPTPEDPLVKLAEAVYEVDAGVDLEDLNERLDLDLPTDADFQTIGGFAFNTLGRLPEPGTSFRDRGVEFTVVEVGEHSIRRLRIDMNPNGSLERSIG